MNRIICLGDSLTLAIGEAELAKWPVRVAGKLEAEFPGCYALFIRAWNGATTFDALQRIHPEVGYLLPATVLVALGANDAHIPAHRTTSQVGVGEFANNLREIHRYIAGRGGNVIFMAHHSPGDSTTYVPGNGKSYAENSAPYRQAILDTAEDLKSPFIDMPSLMAVSGTDTSDVVGQDGLHLSTAGNTVYAKLVYDRLARFLQMECSE